jgi:acyl-CoA synthetase (NDP forming)
MVTVPPNPAPRAVRWDLARMLRPRRVAVFGGDYAEAVIAQSDRIGFDGEIWPVHPKRNSVAGRACVRTVADLPGVPDAAFVGVNRHASISLVEELSHAGAGGAVVFASGFGEAGDEGATLQAALTKAAGKMPVLGPNCYGFINYLDGVLLWPDVYGGARVESGVALVMQSGNMAITVSMSRRALPLAYLVTLGNQACVGMSDVIHALLNDDRVSAIGLHIEGIDNAALLADAARTAVERGVPMVALKVGRTACSAGLTRSHTASLAGNDHVIDALLHRLSIARVDSLPALIETLKLLHMGGPLSGNRLVSLSCSGGEAALMADRAASHAVELPVFSASDRARIAPTVNPLVTISNPFDYHTYDWHHPDRLYATHCAVMQGDQDLTALLVDYPRDEVDASGAWDRAVDAFARAAESTRRRTAVISILPEGIPEPRAAELMARGITPLLGIDDALTAISAAARAQRGKVAPLLEILPAPARDGVTLSEWEAKQELSAFGIDIPTGFACNSATEAVAAARKIKTPVAMKALHPELAHKTEAGAVRLNIRGDHAVRENFDALADFGGEVLVEAMVEDVVAELIVGAARDSVVGLHLFIGAGGVMAEAMKDGAVLLVPVDRIDILDALRSLRIWPLFDGFRGRPAADVDSAVSLVLAVQRFVTERFETLEELDINPLMVRRRGAVAADALIRIRPPA